MERVDQNDAIFTCCQGEISVWILRTVLHLPARAHFGPNQAPEIALFVRITDSFKLMLLTFFVKNMFEGVLNMPLSCCDAVN